MAILASSAGATTLRRGKLVRVQVILKKDDGLQDVIANIRSISNSYFIAIRYARSIQVRAAASLPRSINLLISLIGFNVAVITSSTVRESLLNRMTVRWAASWLNSLNRRDEMARTEIRRPEDQSKIHEPSADG